MSFGGVQRVVKNQLDSFAKDFEITLTLFEKKPIEFSLPKNIAIYYLDERKFDYPALMKKNTEGICAFGKELFDFRVDSLCKILDGLEFDVVLSHEDYDNLITLSALQKSGKQCKTIVTSHVFLENYREKLIHLLDFEFYKEWIQKLYTKATVVAVSSGVSENLKELGIESTVIENGVNIVEVQEKAQADSQKTFDSYILCIGRIEFVQKGQDDLLKAYAKIAEKIPYKLLFVGEGKDREKLEAMINELNLQERVEILGFQKNPFLFMKHATLVAFPSYFEGLPNTILEALAVGAPIVSYDFEPSAKELSENGKYFPLIPRGDIDGLSEEIEELLSDSEKFQSLSQLSKERAEKYSLDSMIEKWRKIIN